MPETRLQLRTDLRPSTTDNEFAAAYPFHSNQALAAALGISIQSVLRRATKLQIRKDPHYWSEVQRQRMSGRRLSELTKARIGARLRGRVLSGETKARILSTKQRNDSIPRGPRHYRWKGGKPWRRFRDARYAEWRSAVLERDNYTCQRCSRQCRKHERGLAAHHIQSFAEVPDLRYVVPNGITLCGSCHMVLHGKLLVPNASVPCACGCGSGTNALDPYGRPRRYINHHHRRACPLSEATRRHLSELRKGKPLTPEHRIAIANGLRRSGKRIGRPPRIQYLQGPDVN